MGSTSTARSRHCRQRKRDGLVQLTIAVSEAGLESLLAHHGLISSTGCDDRGTVKDALERLIELLIAADAAQHPE